MTVKTYTPYWWDEGCNELSSNDPIMKILVNKFNDNKLSSIRNPFYSLCKSIVGQQISVAAASAIWNRLENKYNIFGGQFFILGFCFENIMFLFRIGASSPRRPQGRCSKKHRKHKVLESKSYHIH